MNWHASERHRAYPSPDITGQWTSECPQLGLIMAGDTKKQALAELSMACTFVIEDDLANGFDPRDRESQT